MIDASVLSLLVQSCAPRVAPQTMMALIAVESGGEPFRIDINSGPHMSRMPQSKAEAVSVAKRLIAQGANFDAGLTQINSANFARLGLTPDTLFDPCTNLAAGASVLADNYTRALDAGLTDPLTAAISEYNTGSRHAGIANGYVARVRNAAGTVTANSAASSVDGVASLIVNSFGGRITDTVRARNATYGAANSYHKFGQAVDFVPQGGVHAITRQQVRAVMASSGVRLVELLGPGDPGHSDHWHIAFTQGRHATGLGSPPDRQMPKPQTTLIAYRAPERPDTGNPETELGSGTETDQPASDVAVPSAWNVFAHRARAARPGMLVGGGS